MMGQRRRVMMGLGTAVDVTQIVVTYTGNHTDEIVTMNDGLQYRLLKLTGSGTFSMDQPAKIQCWICGGGAKGGDWAFQYDACNTSGGNGGSFDYSSLFRVPAGAVKSFVIGAAGGGSNHIGALLTGEAWTGWTVGSGGGRGYGRYAAVGVGGGISTVPFSDSYFQRHCAGGGGGSNYGSSYNRGDGGGVGGSNGSDGGNTVSDYLYARKGGEGGSYGGGKGGDGSSTATNGANATFYGGGGGGAGVGKDDEDGDLTGANPGLGYQGVCYIRIPLIQ